MDEKIQVLLDAKAKHVDIELEQELIRIDDEYTARGLDGSGKHLRTRNLAIIKTNARKDKIKAEVEQQLVKLSIVNTPKSLGNPPYNEQKAEISFAGTYTPIPRDTNMETLCKVIFSEKLGFIWLWEDVMTHKKWGEKKDVFFPKNWWRKIYNAALGVNEKVGKATSVYDLLILSSIKNVQINPKYLV